MVAASISFRRWVSYASCLWAVVFGAPHVWWALGVSAGFPGGQANYDFFMGSAWRYVFDVIVVACSALAFLISLTLLRPPAQLTRRWVPLALAWFACGILTLRGAAGWIVDGLSHPYWTGMFTVGGILLGGVAWLAREPRRVLP